MNENQNPNLGNANGVPAPGQAPTAPVANPNIAAPVNPAANPNIAPTPVNPVPGVAPGAPVANPAVGQAPAEVPATPVVNPSLPGMAPAPAAPVADPNIAAPGVVPGAPTANPSLPGMAPAPATPMAPTADPNLAAPGTVPGAPNQAGINIDPNALGTTPAAPAPNAGQPADEGDTKKFETKTVVLVAVAILAVIFAVVYFLFLNPNKKKPAPAPADNTVENNTVNNTTEDDNTTGNTTNNTTPEPEPEPEPEVVEDSDMSWMGSYKTEDMNVALYYSAPKVLEVEITKTSGSGADNASLTLDVTSLTKLTYDDDFLGDSLKLEITKTENGINIKSKSSDVDSVLNFDDEFEKEEIDTKGWSGIYQIDGGRIVINEIYEKGGKIDLSSENSKYGNLSTVFEIKNDKITIKGSSFSKGDTEITKDGDDLVVKSKEYLPGTYKKLAK